MPQREPSVYAVVWVAHSTAAREGEGVQIPIWQQNTDQTRTHIHTHRSTRTLLPKYFIKAHILWILLLWASWEKRPGPQSLPVSTSTDFLSAADKCNQHMQKCHFLLFCCGRHTRSISTFTTLTKKNQPPPKKNNGKVRRILCHGGWVIGWLLFKCSFITVLISSSLISPSSSPPPSPLIH